MESTVEEQNEAEVKANYPGREETESKPRSFPEPILTKEQWAQIKTACEAGLNTREASEVFNVSFDAVRQRALRENWLTPRKIEKMAREQTVAPLSREGQNGEKCAETGLEGVASYLAGSKSRMLLGLHKAAEKGVETLVAANLPVENWQDGKIVADIICKLTGVGQEGVNVNVLVGGDGGFDGPVISLGEDCDMDETGEDD